ncbi:hypothetical protein M3Y96_00975400 [Aphelenchoides besseyi]|nr:hypothetical protein M3Y96_00975400 [Aphelenchoides besseyi]
MKTLVLLYTLIPLSIQKPIGDPCAWNAFTVDKSAFSSYTNARFDSGFFYRTGDDLNTVLDKLDAQVYTYVNFVACDSEKLATHPDSVFPTIESNP